MIQVDKLISARWLATVDSNHSVLEDHCVIVHEKRIVEVLPTDLARQKYTSSREITLANHLLIPGLVNAHGHAAMSLLRGVADDLPLQQWLEQHIWPLEGRFVSEEFVFQGAELAIAEMLLGGTTCFADMYFFPDAVAKAASDAGMRVQLTSPILDFPTAWAQNADEYIQKATKLHDDFRNSELVYTAFGPHAPYTVSDEPLRKIAVLSEELDMPIHMHVHETAEEVANALSSNGKRPLERLGDLGLLGPRFVCVHATQLEHEEIEALARYSAHVVHCPESNMKLASGFCEVKKLLDANVNVAIGTDGCASNNDLDMISEMRSAALLAKAVAGDASALPAQLTLEMATRNGAKALGLEQDIGSIEAGKYADLVAVSMDRINTTPLYNPISQLVYSSQANQVTDVWIAGKDIVQAGELQTLELRGVIKQAREWQQRIANSSSE